MGNRQLEPSDQGQQGLAAAEAAVAALREELRRSEESKSLFLRLLRSQRTADNAETMMATAAEELGRHLRVDRVGFFDMRGDDTLAFGVCWTAGGVAPLTGLFPAAGIGTRYLAEVRAGRTLGISDTVSDPLTVDSRLQEIGARATIGAPIIREGRWYAGTYVTHGKPRCWSEREVGLVREVADQTWDSVERIRAVAALRESLATVGHELRSPLSAIRYSVAAARALLPSAGEGGVARGAGRGVEGGEALRGPIDIIDQQSQHVTRLVNDLVDVNRITLNKLELRLADIDLRRAIAETVAAVQPSFDTARVELALEVCDQPLGLRVDGDRFQQMLGNLLRNAIAYTHPGGRVELSAADRGDAVEICVCDTGIGIDPGELSNLFEPYRQLDSRSGGLGLGLALVKRLVELHGGTVSAHSDGPGAGSSFTLTLPKRR